MSGPARVLVADYPLMRLGVRKVLEGEIEICAEADDAAHAISEAKATQPDLCLVRWEIPGGGVNAIRAIVNAAPGTGIIVLTATGNVDDLLAAVRAGAMGYVPGSVDSEHLRRAVRDVLANEAAVPPSMVSAIMLELRAAASHHERRVTSREAEVLGLLRRGHSTIEIAARLGVSTVTVRRHISCLMRKLDVPDRAALLRDNRVCPGVPAASVSG